MSSSCPTRYEQPVKPGSSAYRPIRFTDGYDRGGRSPRTRLLDAMADSLAIDRYVTVTIAEVVRRAGTSKRTFYENFKDRQECFLTLVREANARHLDYLYGAIDPTTIWQEQIEQAIAAWLECAEALPALTWASIRRPAGLVDDESRQKTLDGSDAFVLLVQNLSAREAFRNLDMTPLTRPRATMLIGAIREMTASALEQGESLMGLRADVVAVTLAILSA